MTKNNIFELNGKAYDALTGAMLGNARRVQENSAAYARHVQDVQPVPILKPVIRSMDGMLSKPKHVNAHQPQPTKTLMRHAVKAPAMYNGQFRPAKTVAASGIQGSSQLQPSGLVQTVIMPKLSSTSIDRQRARRANIVNRSQAVKHFTSTSELRRPSVAPALPVRQAAAATPAVVPMAVTAQPIPIAPYQQHVNQTDDAIYEQDLFEQALAHATSHQETLDENLAIPKSTKSRRKRRQLLGIAGSFGVIVILFAVIAYQNRANIQIQMASAKAGFSATMPLYKPDGYKLGKLAYSPGAVAAIYNHGDSQSFTVTQKKSNWDSQTLLENFVATSNQDYRGYQSNGRTVYVYGKGNATWVNGGIWYQIQDKNDTISDEQLVKIAASI